jgi:hypothetical protein
MGAYRVGSVVLVGVVAVVGCVFWPERSPPDPRPDPGAGPYMLSVRAMEARPAAGLLGGALGMAALDGVDPWWAGTHPKASAETR